MSSQVSDLYKKYHDLIKELDDIKLEHKSLIDKIDKVKLENKDLQSEIILLVKQMASLEKLVHTKYMNTGPGSPSTPDYDDAGNPTRPTIKGNPIPARSKDRTHQYYIINPRTKQIVKNPDYKPKPADDQISDPTDDDPPF